MFLFFLLFALAPFWVPAVVVVLIVSFGWTFISYRRDRWSACGRLLLLWWAAALTVALSAWLAGTWSAWDVEEKCRRELDGWDWISGSRFTETLWPMSSVCTSSDGTSAELVPEFVNPSIVVLAVTLSLLVAGVVRHRHRLRSERRSPGN